MTEYSGRTTAYAHKRDDWREHLGVPMPSAISQVTVFNAQWTDCPVEVEAEIRKLWRNFELGNDHYYFNWCREEVWGCEATGEMGEDEDGEEVEVTIDKTLAELYPVIDEYLMSQGVEKCLIHWWW
jgi:hypothetical protein